MLMEIDPLPMRGPMVMMMVMISTSWREDSPAEQLRRSPRLVPPRFRLVAGGSCPESLLIIFFGRRNSYSRSWAPEGHQGAHEVWGRAQGVGRGPTLVARVWATSGGFFRQHFLLIPKTASVNFQDFWSYVE